MQDQEGSSGTDIMDVMRVNPKKKMTGRENPLEFKEVRMIITRNVTAKGHITI